MNKSPMNELPATLASRVEAARAEPDAASVARAQDRLMQRLRPATVGRARHRGPWFAAGATAILALVAFVAVPLLSRDGDAFAAVRRHFLDFSVLSMRIEQRLSGNLVQASRVIVDARGVLRTDVGEALSIVVDPGNKRVLTLLHESRRGMMVPIQGARPSPDASLQWLQKVRDFQGRAEILPGTRIINGEEARCWSLRLDGQRILLWANDEGLPLEMQVGLPDELQLRFHFEFEPLLPPGHLSSELPAGYVLAGPDAD